MHKPAKQFSFLTHLACAQCGKVFDAHQPQTFCHDCKAPLLAAYDLPAVRDVLEREEISSRPRGMWRWHELLPVSSLSNIVSLGEGDTPLLQLDNLASDLGMSSLWVKDESQNPTGSFKARGLAAAVSKARELGQHRLIIPTAGNAGGAMAAYAARAGIHASIFMPKDTPVSNIRESTICGADVHLVNGLISDAARQVGELAASGEWFDLSTFKEPYRTEGKKVMGYELAESLGWQLPDVIIYPTGGGTGLVGMWKAFLELSELGWISPGRFPRFISVQAAGCAPVVKAFNEGALSCEFWPDAATIASGLRVPRSFADRQIMAVLRDSHGQAVAVEDDHILLAQKLLASREGIFAAPEGAACLAGLQILLQNGAILPGETTILFNTGAGLKYL